MALEELPILVDDVVCAANGAGTCIDGDGVLLGLALFEPAAAADGDRDQVGLAFQSVGSDLVLVVGNGIHHFVFPALAGDVGNEMGFATTECADCLDAFVDDHVFGDAAVTAELGSAILLGKHRCFTPFQNIV